MAIIYPDIELVLVNHLADNLPGVRVGTIKTPPQLTAPTQEVVVTASYSRDREDQVTKTCSVVIETFSNTYESANTLALQAEAALRTVLGEEVKHVDIIVGPTRLPEMGTQHKRQMAAELVVKATDI
jgi:hypothetical protein